MRGPCWVVEAYWLSTSGDGISQACKVNDGSPYIFGIDPNWCETENKLEFYNSLKMKMAVILGVIQMSGGLLLSLLNHVYFKDMKHVWFGFIPEVIFLWFTFGYMCLMIIIKWNTDWPQRLFLLMHLWVEAVWGHGARACALFFSQGT